MQDLSGVCYMGTKKASLSVLFSLSQIASAAPLFLLSFSFPGFIKKEDLRRARSPSDASDITSHTTVSVFSRHSDNGDELSKVLCAAYNGGVSAARDARGKSLPATSFPDALTVAQPYSGKHDVGEAAMRRGVGYAIKEAQNQLVVTDTNNKLLSLVGATF